VETQAFARELVARAAVPLVIDADGLNAFAGSPELLAGRPAATVLTPHEGELGRLLGVGSDAIRAARLRHARAAAEQTGCVVVLKGDDTLVTTPDGRIAISEGGAPGLATAGTGDVLSGIIAAMLAKGLAPEHAAAAGVFAHLHAGRAAEREHGADSVIASDVITALPSVLRPR
jgi:NAD(P)H-hydrate epimerase